MRKAIVSSHEHGFLDLVIANAGICTSTDGISEAKQVIETNLIGTLNTIVPAIKLMLAVTGSPDYSPQIVFMSSLGGYCSSGSVFIAPYNASKNAIRVLAESLRVSFSGKSKIGFSVIAPGMTESRMVSQQMEKGIKMSTGVWKIDHAVRYMSEGIQANKFQIDYPFFWVLVAKLYGCAPFWIKEILAPITTMFDPYHACDLIY